MKITYQKDVNDPPYPIMHGETPLALEFNKRQKSIWAAGNVASIDYQQVSTVMLEILIDDYNKRHAARKRKPTAKK